MSSHPRLLQLIWGAAAAGLLLAGGLFQGPLGREAREHELVAPNVAENHPEAALLTIAPGGLRAPIVNYLWIRANLLKDAGKYYDARQLASLICALQPNFPSVWRFHAWNMAWNISVATHTPEERWLWILNGMELLRDKGIPANPKSLMLYKDLAWIFFSKIGGYMDDYNLEYKQRWASAMQRLLGAPPVGDTRRIIEAFRPIAEAPLDESPARRRSETIQSDQLQILLADPAVARYAELLAAHEIAIDESLLGAYNRFSQDYCAAAVRVAAPQAGSEAERAVADVINDPDHAEARAKLLAFVRAQVLWNVFRMSPRRMLDMMERYQAPLDWRLPWPHAIYWADYGIEVTASESSSAVRVLNADRIILNSLKQLTWNGRLSMIENPGSPVAPYLNLSANWRFIDPTHDEFMRFITAMQEIDDFEFKNNPIHTGHQTFLENAIQMLVAAGRIEQAEKYFQFLKTDYGRSGGVYDEQSARDFVMARLAQPFEDRHYVSSVAVSQMTIALERAFIALGAGDTDGYRRSMAYARSIHRLFQDRAAKRLLLPPFERFAASVLASLLSEPRAVGYNIPLVTRSRMYVAVGVVWERLQVLIYDAVRQPLSLQCRAEGIDFARAFPQPAGLDRYRSRMAAPLPSDVR